MRLLSFTASFLLSTSLPALVMAAEISPIPDYVHEGETNPPQLSSSRSLQQTLDTVRSQVPPSSTQLTSSGKQVISKDTMRMKDTGFSGASTSSTAQQNIGSDTSDNANEFTEIEIRKAPVSSFQPRPAASTDDWSTKIVDAKSKKAKDKFCLMENKFKNNSRLMIAQRADGSSTMGVNYGLDILQGNKEYPVQVQVDDSFDVSFDAYAQSPTTLIIQMGKKSSFFGAVMKGQALHIAMPGVASTFSLTGMQEGLAEFSQCLAAIGSPALSPAKAQPIPQPEPVVPSVAIPPVMSEALSNAPEQVPQPVVMPHSALEREIAEDPVPVPAAQTWSQQALGLLARYGIIPQTVQETADGLTWTSANGNLRSTAKRVENGDMLDTSINLLDQAEQSCDGEFTSQIGLPEGDGDSATQAMESKCVRGNVASISTWLLQQKGKAVIAWIMEASRTQKELAFEARDRLLNAIKQP